MVDAGKPGQPTSGLRCRLRRLYFSQQVADYDRATELEALGGRLVECPASDWKLLGVEA